MNQGNPLTPPPSVYEIDTRQFHPLKPRPCVHSHKAMYAFISRSDHARLKETSQLHYPRIRNCFYGLRPQPCAHSHKAMYTFYSLEAVHPCLHATNCTRSASTIGLYICVYVTCICIITCYQAKHISTLPAQISARGDVRRQIMPTCHSRRKKNSRRNNWSPLS